MIRRKKMGGGDTRSWLADGFYKICLPEKKAWPKLKNEFKQYWLDWAQTYF